MCTGLSLTGLCVLSPLSLSPREVLIMCCTLGIVGGTQCPASYLPKGDADRRANGADADRPAKGEAEGRRKAGDRKLRRVELMEERTCGCYSGCL